MNVGDRVEIIKDNYGQANPKISIVGQTGVIRRKSRMYGWALTMDVELDHPLPDRRKFLWCARDELGVEV